MTTVLSMTDLTTAWDVEPRVKDVRIGERLGMAQPLDIRRTIEANRAELEQYGPIRAVREMVEIGSGARREITIYHLNEGQTLLLCMFSRTERAAAVRKEVIDVFMAWRRGKGAPPPGAVPPSARRRTAAGRLAALAARLEHREGGLWERLEQIERDMPRPSPAYLHRDGLGTIRLDGRTYLFDAFMTAKPVTASHALVLTAHGIMPSIQWAEPAGRDLRFTLASPRPSCGLAGEEALIFGFPIASTDPWRRT